MKKILIFSLNYYPLAGASEKAVQEITNRLPDFDYYLITNKYKPNWPSQEQVGSIKVYRLGRGSNIDKYLYLWRAIAMAAKLQQTIRFDFIWSIGPLETGLAALFFKYRSKVPYLLSDHSSDDDNILQKKIHWYNFYHSRVYRQAKYTQVISKSLGRRSRQMGNQGEIYLIPNGIDLQVFQPRMSAAEQDSLRGELGIVAGDLVLISRAELISQNHWENLIKALNFLIYKSGIPAVLIISGSGPEEYRLMSLAERIGVSDQVLLLGDQDSRQWARYLEIADIFIQVGGAKSPTSVLLEAMAIGVPGVVPLAGVATDFLIEGETGLFYQPGNAASIALAVEKYAHDRDLYQRIKNKAQKMVQEKYSWDTIAKKMGQMFAEKMSL